MLIGWLVGWKVGRLLYLLFLLQLIALLLQFNYLDRYSVPIRLSFDNVLLCDVFFSCEGGVQDD